MPPIFATSTPSKEAYDLVQRLQHYFVQKLTHLSQQYGQDRAFQPVSWLREDGKYGGGTRYEARDEMLFNRGSVNISQVQYEADEKKSLRSATAISTIIHPVHPKAPSVHMHISYTELKSGQSYWRMMADLNPSIAQESMKHTFTSTLCDAFGEYAKAAQAQGERYFFIPALGRHRGVSHFYLEEFYTDNAALDKEMANRIGEATINVYCDLIESVFAAHLPITPADMKAQQEYHTLYFFQVLTLDRGTTSGLLIHNENDVGTLGSLPKTINVPLLASWAKYMPKPQGALLEEMCALLPFETAVVIDEPIKAKLAQVVRTHYQTHPQALSLQASGHTIPPTVANHD